MEDNGEAEGHDLGVWHYEQWRRWPEKGINVSAKQRKSRVLFHGGFLANLTAGGHA